MVAEEPFCSCLEVWLDDFLVLDLDLVVMWVLLLVLLVVLWLLEWQAVIPRLTTTTKITENKRKVFFIVLSSVYFATPIILFFEKIVKRFQVNFQIKIVEKRA